ncbi:MAG: MATE family efflux transporter [Sarcina sp.]
MKKAHLLEKEKISKAILILGVPSILTSMTNVLYNIIDTIFIGRYVGTIGITALAIYLPIQMFISALALLFSSGTGSLISRTLGAKDYEKANKIASNLIATILLMAVILSSIGLIFTKDIVCIFGAKGSVIPYAIDYARPMFIGVLITPFTAALNNIIRAEGNTKYNMNGVIISLVVNIILDYLFIVLLKLGIAGSAFATVFAKLSNLLYIAYYFKFKSFIKLKLKYFRISISMLKEVLPIGLSTFANKLAASLGMVILNHALFFYGGNNAIAIYGVIYRLTSFIQLSAGGLAKGTQPLIGYNFGAKNIKRIKETLRISIFLGTVLALALTAVMFIFAKDFIEIFSTNPSFIKNASYILRISILASPLLGIYFISMSFYRAIGRAKEAFVLSLFRRVIFFLPFIYILPLIDNLNLFGLWLILPLSNLLSATFAFFFLIKYINKNFKENKETLSI